MKKVLFAILLTLNLTAFADGKLTGQAIGSSPYYDYEKGSSSTKVNTAANVFDGNLNTFTATNTRSNGWTWANPASSPRWAGRPATTG